MPKYDYTNSTIDKSDKKRLHFYEELYTILELHESVNEEVNELIGWLGVVLGYYTRLPKSISEKTIENYQIRKYLEEVYFSIDKEICELGIEHNENGERAHSYLYCVETVCPECGWRIPMLPTFVVGIRAGRSILKLKENNGSFDIAIYNSVTEKELSEAKAKGTVKNNSLICPHCGKSTPISSLRHDRIDRDGTTKYGIRLWERNEYEP